MPKTSALILKELGIEAAKITEEDKSKGKTSVGNLSMQQVVKIAKEKQKELLIKDLKKIVKMVLGTCNSMNGVLVENKRPKDVIKEVDEGKWDEIIKA
jgi:large subunit ribosomal protein L11